jgi:hypothetical protein
VLDIDVICDILENEYDPDDILDMLELTSEELVEFCYDKIVLKHKELSEILNVDDEEFDY